MNKFTILFILVILFSVGCISRNNPLDPYGHTNVSAPQKVSGFEGSAHSSTTVRLTWSKSLGINGYYIYRSMSMNGKYERVDNNMLNSGNFEYFLNHDATFIVSQYYWYKISAYTLVGDRKLEGYRSEPIYVYIPQE